MFEANTASNQGYHFWEPIERITGVYVILYHDDTQAKSCLLAILRIEMQRWSVDGHGAAPRRRVDGGRQDA
jgi:hypothetical protein